MQLHWGSLVRPGGRCVVPDFAFPEDRRVNPSERLRLAELVASLSLSLAIDLGLGLPMEHALRSCLICGSSTP